MVTGTKISAPRTTITTSNTKWRRCRKPPGRIFERESGSDAGEYYSITAERCLTPSLGGNSSVPGKTEVSRVQLKGHGFSNGRAIIDIGVNNQVFTIAARPRRRDEKPVLRRASARDDFLKHRRSHARWR